MATFFSKCLSLVSLIQFELTNFKRLGMEVVAGCQSFAAVNEKATI
jgi:hypothetical protein